MSGIENTASEPVAPPRRSGLATVILAVLVLALGVATGLMGREASACRHEAQRLKNMVESQQTAANTRGAAVDAALSPLALDHIKTTEALLKKGDKAAAKSELKEAQTVAKWVRDMGSGKPSAELVTALTQVEQKLGQPPTLTFMPMGGG